MKTTSEERWVMGKMDALAAEWGIRYENHDPKWWRLLLLSIAAANAAAISAPAEIEPICELHAQKVAHGCEIVRHAFRHGAKT